MKTSTSEISGKDLLAKQYEYVKNTAYTAVRSYIRKQGVKGFDEEKMEYLFSDICLKILLSKGYDPERGAALKTWIWTITVNALIDRLKDADEEHEDLYWENEDGDLVEIPELAGNCTPEDVVIGEEKSSVFVNFLERRNDTDRRIFELFTQGFSPKELGEKFGLEANTVAVRIFRMKEQLRREYVICA